MIHEEEKSEILSNFSGEESSFTIDASSSHIFEILRDKQYTNGKESLVRELIANAKDSHVEAGKKDVPIRIWLNQNYLTIQDFGVGLSPQRIQEVYLCYGKSTKRGTNDQQGFYGIGAKSFFSYASSASITSIFDSVKREYAAYINETNVGALRLISEEPTEECNGVSVKIPISSYDLSEFRGYIHKYAQFMNPIPEILGDNVYGALEAPKVIMEGDGWKMFEKYDANQYNILLDGIPYRYDYYGFGSNVQKVTFIFNIGDLIPSATRENLTTCEKNNEALKKAIKKFEAEIAQKTEDALLITEDFTEVIQAIQTSSKYFPSNKKDWKWAGGTIHYPFDENMVKCYHSYGCLRKSRQSVFSGEKLEPKTFVLVPDDFNMWEDVKGYTSRKINYYRRENNLKNVYLVKSCHNIPTDLVTKLEDIKVKNYSSGAKAAPRPKNSPKTHIYCKQKGRAKRDSFLIDDQSRSDIIYTTKNIGEFMHQYIALYSINKKIVEIEEKDVKLIKGKPGWFTIQEYIADKLTDHLTKDEIELEYKKEKAHSAYQAYDYLKEYLHEDFNIGFEPSKLTREQSEIVSFLVSNGELGEPEVPDLFKTYPLLKGISKYEVEGVPGLPSYYSTKAHFNDVVKYVQLINKEQNEQKEEQANV